MIDWAEAGRVAGIGFGLVFLILFILAMAIQAMGMAIRRWGTGLRAKESNQGQNKK